MLRWVFVVDAFVAGGFGVMLLAAPEFMMQFYGVQSGAFTTRLLGAFVLGQAPMLWFARDETATAAGLAIARGHGVIDGISAVLCVTAILSGAMNAQGWVVAILFGAFGSVRLYYGFVARPAVATAA
ncbi:MAG TPA: hypothetical protein VLW85_21215 [Myxococcales bacterium]|nr:hypothetical protein [Myxococcales bacterium]